MKTKTTLKKYTWLGLAVSLGLSATQGASIFWASSTTDAIHRSDISGSGDTTITPDLQQAPYGTTGGPWGVAIANGKVYFTQDNDQKLFSMEYDGSGLTELGSGASIGSARDIHGANNKLYWGTTGGEIKSSDFNGGNISTLSTGAGFMQGIFVNSQYIYYTSSSPGAHRITRLDLNGGNATDLVTSGLNIPYGIWATATNLFWVDLGNGTVSRSDLDGSNVTTLLTGFDRLSGLAVYDDKIYVTEQNGELFRIDLDGSNRTNLVTGLSDARFLEIAPFTVPEPSSTALLGLGGLALMLRRRR